jgi:hypothetical protein
MAVINVLVTLLAVVIGVSTKTRVIKAVAVVVPIVIRDIACVVVVAKFVVFSMVAVDIE